MNRSWLVRAAAIGAGAMLLAGILAPTVAEETSASWADSQAGRAVIKGLTIPTTADTKCESSDTLGGGPVAKVSWTPAKPINGSTVTYKIVGKNKATDPTWSLIVVPPTNSYEFKTGLLDGVLGGILTILLGGGSEFVVGVVAVHAYPHVQWESEVVSTGKVVKAQGGLANLIEGFKCVNTPPN